MPAAASSTAPPQRDTLERLPKPNQLTSIPERPETVRGGHALKWLQALTGIDQRSEAS